MSEAAATPAPEPLTLEEAAVIIAAEIPVLTREIAAARRVLEAGKLTPGRQVTDTALLAFESRIKDAQWELMGALDVIRQAGEVQSFNELRQAALTPAAEPEQEPARRGRRLPGQRTAGHHRALKVVGAERPPYPPPGVGGLVPRRGAGQPPRVRVKPAAAS